MKKEKNSEIKKRKKLCFTKKQKIFTSVTAVVLLIAITAGLLTYFLVFAKKAPDYSKYFNDFSSTSATGAEVTLNHLSENTVISSYNSAYDVFITKRTYPGLNAYDESGELYGFASSKYEYIEPKYCKVLQIKGDYAIVLRPGMPAAGEDISGKYLEVLKFRGENAPYSLMGGKSVYYISSFFDPKFVGDYLVVYGTKDEPSFDSPQFATFYDYKSYDSLYEKFRIRQAYDDDNNVAYEYICCDDYVVARTDYRSYYYNTETRIIGGYLEQIASYDPFSYMTEDALKEFEREQNDYYLGGGWFLRSARIYKNWTPFEGFNLLIKDTGYLEYSRTVVSFYNVKTGENRADSKLDYVVGVANEYTFDEYEYQTFFMTEMGNAASYDSERKIFYYELPFENPASLVKKGYSFIYYYIQPYHGVYEPDEEFFYDYSGEVTYCICDDDFNISYTDRSLLPICYTDGIGYATSSPTYSEYAGDAYVYDKNMEAVVVANKIPGSESYITCNANKYACILQARKYDAKGVETGKYYGAVTPDGKRITEFIYDMMTYYSGGYCIGCRQAEDGTYKYFRIDEKGNETLFEDVYILFQGVYLAKDENDLYSLKNYAGDVLIEPTEGEIFVLNSGHKYGRDMITYAAVTYEGYTKIYEITCD